MEEADNLTLINIMGEYQEKLIEHARDLKCLVWTMAR